MQANCSILPDGLCAHSHIPSLHAVYSHGHPELPKRVSAQMVSLWKVPGRKSEAESQDLPTPHSTAQLRNPCRFHQHHSRIPVSRPCPPPSSWDSSEIWVPGDPGKHTCKVQGPLAHTQPLEVRDFSPKAWGDSLPIRIPGPSSCLSPEVPMNWGQGGRPVPSCSPLPALHIWPRRRSSERMEGMSVTECPAAPAPTLYRQGP